MDKRAGRSGIPARLSGTKLESRLKPKLRSRYRKLEAFISQFTSAAVAYSGGADSSLVAYIGSRVLGDMLCVTENSPAFAREELESARKFCKQYEIPHMVIMGTGFADKKFTRNTRDRCYYCKSSLFAEIEKIRRKKRLDVIFDGSNYDDIGDYRPGRRAVSEFSVRSPLLECGMAKKDIRALSKALGLPTWNRPQMACLSSRVPYGTPISKKLLGRIAIAEQILKSAGYKNVRARYHGDILRIEIDKREKIDIERLRAVAPEMKKQGFKYIVLDIEGYRTGSMNE